MFQMWRNDKIEQFRHFRSITVEDREFEGHGRNTVTPEQVSLHSIAYFSQVIES